MNLCRFLALRIPEKEAGGRNGRNTYIELTEKAQYVSSPDFLYLDSPVLICPFVGGPELAMGWAAHLGVLEGKIQEELQDV